MKGREKGKTCKFCMRAQTPFIILWRRRAPKTYKKVNLIRPFITQRPRYRTALRLYLKKSKQFWSVFSKMCLLCFWVFLWMKLDESFFVRKFLKCCHEFLFNFFPIGTEGSGRGWTAGEAEMAGLKRPNSLTNCAGNLDFRIDSSRVGSFCLSHQPWVAPLRKGQTRKRKSNFLTF